MSKQQKQPINEESEMTFWSHLEALRWHLVRSIIVVFVLAMVAFSFKEYIFNTVILAPKSDDFISNRILCKLGGLLGVEGMCNGKFNLTVINIRLAGQFMTHLYISIMAALIAGAPYFVWELWRFIKPALNQKEQRHSRGAVVTISALFYIGILFSYFLIVPLTINFLGSYSVSAEVANQINLSSYISTVLSVTMALGIVFELPVLIYFLARTGIVTDTFLRKNRKVMLVLILILSAIITPPDVVSQILVAFPLMFLYEVSIRIAKRVGKKQESAV